MAGTDSDAGPVTYGIAAVPEPSTVGGAITAALFGIGCAWRRKRAAA